MLVYVNEGIYSRDLLVLRGGIGDSIVQRLLGSERDVLQLEQRSEVEGFHSFHQRNTKASRKIVMPIVKNILLEMRVP